jgi:hypothetical protein
VSPKELCGLDVVTPMWMRSSKFISLGFTGFRAPANKVLMNNILSDDEFFMVIGGNEGIISTVCWNIVKHYMDRNVIWGVGGDAPPFNVQIYIGFISYWWQFLPMIFHSLGEPAPSLIP